MGSGIAQLALQQGLRVTLRDVEDGLVREGHMTVEKGLESAETGGYVDDAGALLDRLETTTEVAALADADAAVEAVVEDLDVKKQVFRDLETTLGDDALLCTNTSSLSVTEIASAVGDPERVVGTHFFNPPVKMRLLEIVRGHRTSERTVARAEALGDALDRETVLVEDVPGFATSRLGVALGMEAARMVQEGVASAEDIDTAMRLGYNFPMGPLELGDQVGWDVRVDVGEYLAEELGREVYRPPQNVKRMVRAGDYGRKTGRGFYGYDDGDGNDRGNDDE
ncbi:3-hydroxybutyryl-CoA dehydrogenase [Halobacteriales archaeon SW_5_70_135]|nr:MAG: 3-hydroxybutyryl-CoA dehydrogenase [Halobacteriales archaeon SW_5_70_135]